MKKIFYYLLISFFAFNGAYGMFIHEEFSFWWWLSALNVFWFGGLLMKDLLEFLEN